MTDWHPSELVREILANLAARPLQSVGAALLAAAVLVGVGLSELSSATSIDATAAGLVASGSTTARIATTTGAALPAAACARLDGQHGIVAAGGIGAATTVEAASSPSLGFPEAAAVGNLVGALSGGSSAPPGAGLVLSDELASQLGVVPGSYLDIRGRAVRVAAVAALGARDPFFGRLALAPSAPVGTVQACYVQVATGEYASALPSLLGAFPGVSGLTISTVLPTTPGVPTPAADWAGRLSRFAWVAGGVVLGAVFLLASRARHHELAVYVVTGTRRTTVALLRLGEIDLVVSAGAVVALAWLGLFAVLGHGGWAPARAALVAVTRAALLAVATAPLGLAWMARRDLLTLLKERTS